MVVASKGGRRGASGLVPEPDRAARGHRAGRGDRFTARARTATAEEKPELWRLMTERWPAYDEYQRKTAREIPVVVLEREE